MTSATQICAITVALTVFIPSGSFAANHREAPITALDRLADMDPAYGLNYFRFDPEILYEIKIDNDAVEDVIFSASAKAARDGPKAIVP